jgi:hypothetical protein
MGIKLAWTNRSDAASLAADSEKADLPGTNVQQPHVSRQWHTAAGVKTGALTLDFGSGLACDVIAVLGTNLTSVGTIRVRASTSDPTATGSLALDTGTLASGCKTGYGQIYKSFASTSARYWRIDLADASVPDNLQVGRAFLGPSWAPTVDHLIGSGSITADDSDSKVSRSYGGQSYPDERPQARVFSFELAAMSEAEMYGNAFAMARAQGVVRDVLAVRDFTGSYLPEQAVWGLLEASTPLINHDVGVYRQKFTIRERL